MYSMNILCGSGFYSTNMKYICFYFIFCCIFTIPKSCWASQSRLNYLFHFELCCLLILIYHNVCIHNSFDEFELDSGQDYCEGICCEHSLLGLHLSWYLCNERRGKIIESIYFSFIPGFRLLIFSIWYGKKMLRVIGNCNI